jgi:hypothetical protein
MGAPQVGVTCIWVGGEGCYAHAHNVVTNIIRVSEIQTDFKSPTPCVSVHVTNECSSTSDFVFCQVTVAVIWKMRNHLYLISFSYNAGKCTDVLRTACSVKVHPPWLTPAADFSWQNSSSFIGILKWILSDKELGEKETFHVFMDDECYITGWTGNLG